MSITGIYSKQKGLIMDAFTKFEVNPTHVVMEARGKLKCDRRTNDVIPMSFNFLWRRIICSKLLQLGLIIAWETTMGFDMESGILMIRI